ncbi:MAG: hypothetical protein JWN76_1220 [Chitinophagaceae bacterium]|nr:hypothetical protein [Chitinophagaceae bacterium]
MGSNQNNTNIQPIAKRKINLKQRLMNWIRLSGHPTIKVYRGFGNSNRITVMGQVFQLSPLPRKRYRRNVWTNTFALLRLFIVQPYANASIVLLWKDQEIECITEKEGFFRIEFSPANDVLPGWHDVTISLKNYKNKYGESVTGKGQVLVPYVTQYGCISDIDDTFLISHSTSLWKRLYVLFTENARSRKPFEGVVKHYQLLAYAGTNERMPNPFFYVSSSEWNLYDYIVEFANDNKMPPGVYLLNQLKKLNQLVKTGQNKHKTKFFRIVRILEAFPNQRFILLGDDSQEDPFIYKSVVEHFPKQIVCVYLRQVAKRKKDTVLKTIADIETLQVPCFYFIHSSDAALHSIKIGLAGKENVIETFSINAEKDVPNEAAKINTRK